MSARKHLLIATALLPLCVSVLTAQESIGNPVEQIKRFAPDNADLLIVVRPKQLMASTFWKTATSINAEQTLAQFPKEFDRIELFLALTSMSEVFPRQPDEADLKAVADESHPALTSITDTSVGLIRFETPVQVKALKDWLAQHPERLGLEAFLEEPKYQKATWHGHEVFHCSEPTIPAIHRLDPRTFVVASSKLMRKRLAKSRIITTPIDPWLQTSVPAGDIFIAVDLNSIHNPVARMSRGVPLEKVQSAAVRLDFSGPELLAVRCRLSKPQHAGDLVNTFENYRRLGMTALTSQARGAEAEQAKRLAEQAVPILRSIRIGARGGAVAVTLPRPNNWDELLTAVATDVIETQKNYEAKIKESISSRQTTKVFVVNRQLARGETIEAEDVISEDWPADRVPQGAFTRAADVVGSRAKREIFPGEPLVSSNVLRKSTTVPVAKP